MKILLHRSSFQYCPRKHGKDKYQHFFAATMAYLMMILSKRDVKDSKNLLISMSKIKFFRLFQVNVIYLTE